ncbi:pyridoxal phosphate-dependent aminotransferase [Cetobacterium sp. SF1]|uniref:pyridoxal phosphate-dependent aminotransferase n=1 Tax=Cetobacterium sp. SF1 TaxID=3417654 RepID=UPI003CF5E882
MNNEHGANIFDLENILNIDKNNLLDFSSNINPYGASLKAKEFIKNNIDIVSLYPDSNYKNLRNAISNYSKTPVENLILGNGATELISSFIKTLNPKTALLIAPIYSEYEKELKKINCSIHKLFYNKDQDFELSCEQIINYLTIYNIELLILCNPNNPTGKCFSKKEIEKILMNYKGHIMIDETYIEFTDMDTYSVSGLEQYYDNIFLIRGTSKFFSTPGIRLGYAISSNKTLIKTLNSIPNLWNINIVADFMGQIMFEDKEYIEKTQEKIKEDIEFLFYNLKLLKEIKVYKTHSNFILCELLVNKSSVNDLCEFLLKKNIIIRNLSNFEGLPHNFFRICSLTKENNKFLIDNIKLYFNTIK